MGNIGVITRGDSPAINGPGPSVRVTLWFTSCWWGEGVALGVNGTWRNGGYVGKEKYRGFGWQSGLNGTDISWNGTDYDMVDGTC
jgi:hypothetical protein